jgi:VanZ family protein
MSSPTSHSGSSSRRRRYAGAERRVARPSPIAVGLALLVFAGIAFATLCPQNLRPHLAGPDQERFGAYFVLGVCAAFAFPRRANLVVFGVSLAAFALEAGQLLIPGRDAGFSDACVKAMGGLWGVFAAQASYAVKRRLFPGRRRRIRSTGTATTHLMRGSRSGA